MLLVPVVMEPVVRTMNTLVPMMRPRRMIRTFMTMWTPTEAKRALAQRTRPRAKTSLRIWRSKLTLSLFDISNLNHAFLRY